MKVEHIYRTLTAYEVAQAERRRNIRFALVSCAALALVGVVAWIVKG